MWHDMDDVGWVWWVLMSIGMVVFWGFVVYAILTLARGGPPFGPGPAEPPAPPAASEPPRELLKRRLAAGEIDVEEYERLRAVIEGEPPAPPPPQPAAH